MSYELHINVGLIGNLRHVDGRLNYRRNHGKARLLHARELQEVNLVLTTYHTVAAEWKSKTSDNVSVLFSVHWHRIILDEGWWIIHYSITYYLT